ECCRTARGIWLPSQRFTGLGFQIARGIVDVSRSGGTKTRKKWELVVRRWFGSAGGAREVNVGFVRCVVAVAGAAERHFWAAFMVRIQAVTPERASQLKAVRLAAAFVAAGGVWRRSSP